MVPQAINAIAATQNQTNESVHGPNCAHCQAQARLREESARQSTSSQDSVDLSRAARTQLIGLEKSSAETDDAGLHGGQEHEKSQAAHLSLPGKSPSQEAEGTGKQTDAENPDEAPAPVGLAPAPEAEEETEAKAPPILGARPDQAQAAEDAPRASAEATPAPTTLSPGAAPSPRTEEKETAKTETPPPGSDPENARLSSEEQAELAQLKTRDSEVRAHEAAHKAAAGQYGGAISFEYTRGPDGGRYAVAGHVPVDLSPISGDPTATLAKARQLQRAALAPKDPSTADRSVSSRAAQLARQAQAELAEKSSATKDSGDTKESKNDGAAVTSQAIEARATEDRDKDEAVAEQTKETERLVKRFTATYGAVAGGGAATLDYSA